MTTNYAKRKEYRLRLRAALIPELVELPTGYVEAVARYSLADQHTLAQARALQLPTSRVLEMLSDEPGLSLELIVGALGRTRLPSKPVVTAALADLIAASFPDMLPASAAALAAAPALTASLHLLEAWQICLASPQTRSDFNVVILCALLGRMKAELSPLLSIPVYAQALAKSSVAWDQP